MTEVSCVINDLLCFISSALNSYEKELIIHQALGYYSETDIKNAKSIICKHAGVKPTWRRKENRLWHDLMDVIDLVIQEKDADKLQRYVADNYQAFPPLFGYETIANDLKTLKNDIVDIKENIEATSQDRTIVNKQNSCDTELETIKEELFEIKKFMFDYMQSQSESNEKETNLSNSSFMSSLSVREIPTAPPYSQLPVSPLLLSRSPPQQDKPKHSLNKNKASNNHNHNQPSTNAINQNGKQDIDRSNNYSGKLNYSKVAASHPKSINAKTKVNGNYEIDEDGFQKKIKKPRIVGTKNTSEGNLKAVVKTRTKVIYIGRLEEKTTVKDIEEHIKSEIGMSVIKCYKLKCSMDKCSSFKVIIDPNNIDKIMNDSVWPEGTLIREFIYRNENNENNSNVQSA